MSLPDASCQRMLEDATSSLHAALTMLGRSGLTIHQVNNACAQTTQAAQRLAQLLGRLGAVYDMHRGHLSTAKGSVDEVKLR